MKLLAKTALLGATALGLAACGGGGGGATGGGTNVSESGIVVGSTAPSTSDEVTISGVLIQNTIPSVADFDVTGATTFSFFDSVNNPSATTFTDGPYTLTITSPDGTSEFSFVRYMEIDDGSGNTILSLVGTRSGNSVIAGAPGGDLVYVGTGTVAGTYWTTSGATDFSGGDATITVNLTTDTATIEMDGFDTGSITSIDITGVTVNGSSFEGGTISVAGTPSFSSSIVDYHDGGLYGAPNFGGSADGGPGGDTNLNAPPEAAGVFLETQGDNTVFGRYAGD